MQRLQRQERGLGDVKNQLSVTLGDEAADVAWGPLREQILDKMKLNELQAAFTENVDPKKREKRLNEGGLNKRGL